MNPLEWLCYRPMGGQFREFLGISCQFEPACREEYRRRLSPLLELQLSLCRRVTARVGRAGSSGTRLTSRRDCRQNFWIRSKPSIVCWLLIPSL